MGFFSKLLSKNDWKKTLVRDLVTLTAVDGDMDKDEVAFAFKVATNELGFTEQKFVDLMQNLGKVQDIYPDNEQDKLVYLQYLLQMTYVDGYVDDNEVQYMKIIAERMNLPASAIDKAIAYFESTDEDASSYADEEENDLTEEFSENKTVITSPYNPILDLQSEDDGRKYILKLSKLTRSDLCTELSNIMAAKHNLLLFPSGVNEYAEKQKIVTSLTDKAALICIHEFGQDVIRDYCGEDIRKLNALINEIDDEVAQTQLYPDEHGCMMLKKLSQILIK